DHQPRPLRKPVMLPLRPRVLPHAMTGSPHLAPDVTRGMDLVIDGNPGDHAASGLGALQLGLGRVDLESVAFDERRDYRHEPTGCGFARERKCAVVGIPPIRIEGPPKPTAHTERHDLQVHW